jgi:hypothetical protein
LKNSCLGVLVVVQDFAEATKQLELAIQMTPWALTDNFISALREQRGSLALTGPGDPTARGDGFSYMKETAKVLSQIAKFVQLYSGVVQISPKLEGFFFFFF